MKKRTRYDLSYKIRMWFYRLTKKDIYNFTFSIIDGLGVLFAAITIFIFLFFIPAFFY